MKKVVLTGTVLVLLGGWMITYQGLTYLTVDLFHPQAITVPSTHPGAVYLPPLMGAITFGVGVVLLIVGLVRDV